MAAFAGTGKSSIAVDVMGSDKGPAEILAGVQLALDKLPHLPDEFVLVGDEAVIKPVLESYGIADNPHLRILHASEVISMDDKPLRALKTKKDSSMAKAIELVKSKESQVVVSCGNTGSLMAGGTLRLRTLPGIARPALGAVVPSESSHWVLIDAGANPTATPDHLVTNAILGKNYCKVVLNKENPRVGLLTIGTEEGKGTELINGAHNQLKKLTSIMNYVGPIEGFQTFSGDVDVVVCDGFTGNVILKSSESLFHTLQSFLKKELTANPWRKIGAGMCMGAFKAMKNQLSPDRYSGAPLLGLNGNILKSHGSSDRHAIVGALSIASEIIERDMDHLILDDVEAAQKLLSTSQVEAK